MSTGNYSDLRLDVLSLEELSSYVYQIGKTYFYGPEKLFGTTGVSDSFLNI